MAHSCNLSTSRAMKSLIAIIGAFLTLPVFAQTPSEKALRDIETHRAWVETHVPVADTLDDEQLIMATIDAVVSTCVEDKYVELIREAGRRFGLNGLEKYADLRANGAIDRSDSLGSICLGHLYEQALTTCGSPSYTTAFAAMQAWNNASAKKDREHWTDLFVEEAEKLYRADSCNRNKELWLLSRWAKLFKGVEYENPLLYKPCRQLMAETLHFEHDYQGNPAVSNLLYATTYNNSIYSFTNYSTYYAHIDLQLDADSILRLHKRDVIPNSESTDYIIGTDLLKLEFSALKKLYHSTHPDLIRREVDYMQEACLNGDTAVYANCMNRLKEILEYQKAYYPVPPMSLMTRIAIRQHEVDQIVQNESGVNRFHAKDWEEDWEFAKKFVSENERAHSLINYLSQEFNRQIVCDIDNATCIFKEIEKLCNEGMQSDPYADILYRTQSMTLEREGLPYSQGAFRNLSSRYLELSQSEDPSWKSVYIGKVLADYATNYFGDLQTAISIQRARLLQLKKLVGKESPVFCYQYIGYANMAVQSHMSAITLEGTDDIQALIDDMLSTCSTSAPTISCPAYLCAAQFHSYTGDHKKSDAYFKEIIRLSDGQPASAKENIRIHCYTGLLESAILRNCFNDTIQAYADELAAYTRDIHADNARQYQKTQLVLAHYYMNSDQFKEGKALLEKCIAFYDSPYFDPMDGNYIQFVTLLANYYAGIESDMNKSLELAEKAESKMQNFKDLSNYENYIGLLRIVYELIKIKTPYDDTMLNKYEALLSTNIQRFYVDSGYNPNVWLSQKLYLYLQYISKSTTIPQRRANAITTNSLEKFEEDQNAYKSIVTQTVLPDLLAMKAYLEEKGRQNSRYHMQISFALAMAYDNIIGDAEEAEKYYKKVAETQTAEALVAIISFYLTHERYAEALPFSKRLEELWNECTPAVSSDVQNTNWMQMQLAGTITMTHYLNRDYTTALRHAREYHRNTWAYINKNFDLFTQNERETFLNTYSAGGGFLKMLLPEYPEEIAGEVYDCMLQEKGLLLRSAERVRHAIFASGNRELIASLDSINRLTQQISLMEKDKLATADGQKDLLGLRERLDRLERYASRESEPYRRQDDVPAWTAVRDKLRKGEAAVEYVVTDSATMALVLTPGCKRPQYIRLIGAEDTRRITERLSAGKFRAIAVDFYEDDTEQLYKKLWQPLEKYFDGAKHIYFSPSAYLNSLAFAAFRVEEGEYLVDRYELHQLTTTAQLAHREKQGKAGKAGRNTTATIYGSIFYNASQAEEYTPLLERLAAEAPALDPGKARAAARTEPFPFLESTPSELQNIRRSLAKSKVHAVTQEGNIPTEEAFRMNDGHSPDILHISTHGFYFATPAEAAAIPYFRKFSNLYPMNCTGLALSGAEQTWKGADLPLESDNILTSNEIAALNLESTRLVVLSACETALGASNNDGVFGLQRGFKLAGVRSVCASLWSVNDASTASLMQTFYHLWLNEGIPMQEAYKRAMIEQRAKTPAPYYWAPFVMLDADI